MLPRGVRIADDENSSGDAQHAQHVVVAGDEPRVERRAVVHGVVLAQVGVPAVGIDDQRGQPRMQVVHIWEANADQPTEGVAPWTRSSA